jgi:uncharacterized protein (UPF0261 family)
MSKVKIIVMGTHDTKGEELRFVKQRIESKGHEALTLDCGVMGRPAFEPGISREEVAAAAKTSIEKILAKKDKNFAIGTMTEGAKQLVLGMHGRGELDGIIALGGGQGTVMGTTVMKALPFGVPKVMISAVANGQAPFGPFVGIRDITIIHSVADVLGLNIVTRRVLAEGAGAIVGMVEMSEGSVGPEDRPTVAMTTAGVTTPCAMRIRELLFQWGYEVIAFHCNGIGAQAMEELAEAGELAGILDLSPHDIPDVLFGGIFPAHEDRMGASVRRGVPQLIIPGAADFILFGPVEETPKEMLERKHIIHNPLHTHVRANREEMAAVGRYIAERLSQSTGPAAVLIPNGGFTQLNIKGGPMYEPESDRGFVEGLREVLDRLPEQEIPIREIDLHINDPAFAEQAAAMMHELIRERGKPIE